MASALTLLPFPGTQSFCSCAASAWGAQAARKKRCRPRSQRHVMKTATKLTCHHIWKRKESRTLRIPSLLGKSTTFQRAIHQTCSCHQIGSSMRSIWRNSTSFWRERRNYPPLWLTVLRRSEKGATSRYLSGYLCEILWAACWRWFQRRDVPRDTWVVRAHSCP